MSKFVFYGVLLALLAGASSFAQEKPNQFEHRIRGLIKTADAAVITGLALTFKSESREINGYTDGNGEFEAALPAGLYRLTADRPVAKSFTAYVKIVEQGVNPAFIEFTVEADKYLCGLDEGQDCPTVVKENRPKYPPAALAVRASGEVVVGVKIDPAGNVVAAAALSGHPLLRRAASDAAKEFRFAAAETEREAKLSFVFSSPVQEKPNLKRFANPYRIVVAAPIVTIEYSTAAARD